MPDTGAPWNIPYVASTDLVSDWPTDSLALANAIDAGLDAASNAGIGSNVVSYYSSSNFTSSASGVTVTDYEVTITPTSASSKILVLATMSCDFNTRATRGMTFNLRYSGSTLSSTFITSGNGSSNGGYGNTGAIVFLHSPATTSPVTYSFTVSFVDGTLAVQNRSVTAIEVAA